MASRIMGVETEYAYVPLSPDGGRVDALAGRACFTDVARSLLPHLNDRDPDSLYLENGARLYYDCGNHPEMASPECTTPWDVVRYVLAGDRIMARIADGIGERYGGKVSASFFKCNVAYGPNGFGGTWGCHESFLHRANPRSLPDQLVPHLVARIIFTGAGGFNNRTHGTEFLLSPRVAHLMHEKSDSSTRARGIFHEKDELLSNTGTHRLHLLCGESLCSETAMWLKTATTAAILTLAEVGFQPGKGVALHSPLDAMRAFARDPECKVAVATADGQMITAIEIERHYLAVVRAHARESFMPWWTEELCRVWGRMLDRLEDGAPDSVATTLDWAIKLALYKEEARRCGIAWKDLARWSHVTERLRTAMDETSELSIVPLSASIVHAPYPRILEEVSSLTGSLCDWGLSWDGFAPYLRLRSRLFETDMRFAQVGPTGVFASLDRARALDHHFPGVENIGDAMTTPPFEGRARLRGKYVKALARTPECVADWQGVWDAASNRLLDLSDPLSSRESWKAGEELIDASPLVPPQLVSGLVQVRKRRLENLTEVNSDFQVNDIVILGRHGSRDDDENWVSEMDDYIGRVARIVELAGQDQSGSPVVRVDCDGQRYVWRTSNLQLVPFSRRFPPSWHRLNLNELRERGERASRE